MPSISKVKKPARKPAAGTKPASGAARLVPIDITFNVIGYEEDGEWIALALEMDLRGYGSTFEEACEDLYDLVVMQISFAVFKGQPEMIWKPAEPIWFQRFAEVRRERLDARLNRLSAPDPHFDVASLPLPPAHVIDALQADFLQA